MTRIAAGCLALFALLAVVAPAARAAEEARVPASDVPGLLRRLDAETLSARETALERLAGVQTLDTAALHDALAAAGPRARPLVLELIGRRGVSALTGDVVRAATDGDPLVVEAALRALVLIGADAVAAGREALAGASARDSGAADARVSAARSAVRLEALWRQHAVEQVVISKWRRKGGLYRGRYAELNAAGWYAQPVLLAMLLDVPLEDRFVVVPDEDDPEDGLWAKRMAIEAIVTSTRRGYRTFEPLPTHILDDDLFNLAQQALRDVGDMDLLGRPLEDVAERLLRAHDEAPFQLRPFEKRFAEDIATVLYTRGRKRLLEEEEKRLRMRVDSAMSRVRRSGDGSRWLSIFITEAGDLASTLHMMERFDEAAEWYATVNAAQVRLAGEPSAISSYNRACALALGGRKDEALEQLDAALALDTSDLTREWVAEDGDLRSLHGDPRFAKILERHFDR